jgi:hypothetical protein
MDRLLLAGLLVVILGVPRTVHLGIFKKIQNVTVSGFGFHLDPERQSNADP